MSRPSLVAGSWRPLMAIALVATGALAGCSGEERSAEALCPRLAAFAGLDEALARGDLDAVTSHGDALRRATEVAPEDIELELSTLADMVDEVLTSAGTADGEDRAALLAGIDEALPRDRNGTDVLSMTGAAVEFWSIEHCGLDLGSGTTVTPAADRVTPTDPAG